MGREFDTREAMERFLSSVERSGFRMARLAVGNDEDALDIVQEAMLGLVRKYSDRPGSEWKALFFRILQNRIRDFFRRRTVRSRWRVWLKGLVRGEQGGGAEREDPVATLPDTGRPGPEKRALLKVTASALEEALGGLPLRQQQVFFLRAWQEMSVKETAEAMGCSEGTVKTLYSRAVHTLRERLGEWRP